MVTVIEDPIEEFSEGQDSDIEIIEDPSSQPSNRKPRKPRGKTGLPDFMQDTWKVVVVPTLLDMIGQCDNVWTVEKGTGDEFRDKVQDVIDDVHPEEHYEVKRSGKVFQMVRLFFCASKTPHTHQIPDLGQTSTLRLACIFPSCRSKGSESRVEKGQPEDPSEAQCRLDFSVRWGGVGHRRWGGVLGGARNRS